MPDVNLKKLIDELRHAHNEHIGFKDALLDVEFYIIELQNLLKEKERNCKIEFMLANDLALRLLLRASSWEPADYAVMSRYKETHTDE
jgi:hypothetical protein